MDRFKGISAWLLFASLITCMALSGIADQFLEWRYWFEHGFMSSWRDAKIWTAENFFFWFPSLPLWVLDYLVIGLVFPQSAKVMLVHRSPETKFDYTLRFMRQSLSDVLSWPIQIPFAIVLIKRLNRQAAREVDFGADHNEKLSVAADNLYADVLSVLFWAILFFTSLLLVGTDFQRTFS